MTIRSTMQPAAAAKTEAMMENPRAGKGLVGERPRHALLYA